METTSLPARDIEICFARAPYTNALPVCEETEIVVPNDVRATYRGEQVLRYEAHLGSGSIGDVSLFSDAYRGSASRNISVAVKFFSGDHVRAAAEEQLGFTLAAGQCKFVSGRVVPVLRTDNGRPYIYENEDVQVSVMHKVGHTVEKNIGKIMKAPNIATSVRNTSVSVLESLACLHGKGLVYADLTPHNVTDDECHGLQFVDAGAIIRDGATLAASSLPPIQSSFERMLNGEDGYTFEDKRGDVAYSWALFSMWSWSIAYKLTATQMRQSQHRAQHQRATENIRRYETLATAYQKVKNTNIKKIGLGALASDEPAAWIARKTAELKQALVAACQVIPSPVSSWCEYALGENRTVTDLLQYVKNFPPRGPARAGDAEPPRGPARAGDAEPPRGSARAGDAEPPRGHAVPRPEPARTGDAKAAVAQLTARLGRLEPLIDQIDVAHSARSGGTAGQPHGVTPGTDAT